MNAAPKFDEQRSYAIRKVLLEEASASSKHHGRTAVLTWLQRQSRLAVTAAAVASSMLLGGAAFALSEGSWLQNWLQQPCIEADQNCVPEPAGIPDWPVNEYGQTYGSAATSSPELPELVSVIATNGRQGYAYSEQLSGPEFTSPAEALKWQEENAGKAVEIPVYEVDGRTVIGTFEMGPG